jgi:hypothetical protein
MGSMRKKLSKKAAKKAASHSSEVVEPHCMLYRMRKKAHSPVVRISRHHATYAHQNGSGFCINTS